ncbi:hypothetical protein GS504_02825 [Rhodococcus hoagii]|nr:hypothetical protein [Prescottella equi]
MVQRPDRRAGKTPVQLWVDGVAHLEAFIAEHGHARVPKGHVCADGMRLASWVMHRREDRRLGADRLTPDRIAQLDALGFDWAPSRPGRSVDDFAEQWAAILARPDPIPGRARQPRRAAPLGVRGRIPPRRVGEPAPHRPTTPDADVDPGADRPARRARLQLGPGNGPRGGRAAEVGERYRPPHRLRRRTRARPSPLTGFTCSDGFRLGLWVTGRRGDRRHSRPSLTPDRITALDNLSFDWGTTRTKS